jgi:hypothetical protein
MPPPHAASAAHVSAIATWRRLGMAGPLGSSQLHETSEALENRLLSLTGANTGAPAAAALLGRQGHTAGRALAARRARKRRRAVTARGAAAAERGSGCRERPAALQPRSRARHGQEGPHVCLCCHVSASRSEATQAPAVPAPTQRGDIMRSSNAALHHTLAASRFVLCMPRPTTGAVRLIFVILTLHHPSDLHAVLRLPAAEGSAASATAFAALAAT